MPEHAPLLEVNPSNPDFMAWNSELAAVPAVEADLQGSAELPFGHDLMVRAETRNPKDTTKGTTTDDFTDTDSVIDD